MSLYLLPDWPYVYGGPSAAGELRAFSEDFIVEEMLSFEPSGSGEHVFLSIRKKNENTEYVARQLARFAGVRQRDIGFAGLKDRHAVTTQWFSVWLPGKIEPNWNAFASASIEVLQTTRHARKLQRGALTGNRFKLIIRSWRGDWNETEAKLHALKAGGVANYFGEQRFGYLGNNIKAALNMFAGKKVGREQRAIYLSAARAFLFNQVLAARVMMQNWNLPITGDVLMIDQSHSRFVFDAEDKTILDRVAEGRIHPTGSLWGRGDCMVSGAAMQLEQETVARYPELSEGLIKNGIERERRTLRVNVKDLCWGLDGDRLHLSFFLPAGSYATALLRELLRWDIQ